MQITFHQVSKRYHYDWIFKGVSHCFEQGGRYAVVGPNGSGKSTLMKVLSGHLSPSKGKVEFWAENKKLAADGIYRHVAYAAPYIELIEEFTLREAIDFHQKFKPLQAGLSSSSLIGLLGFERAKNKQLRHFSSGMKQRLKLALALCTSSTCLLLDEPTTNLDQQGIEWYLEMVEEYSGNRTCIVASNVEVDFGFCPNHVNILDYK